MKDLLKLYSFDSVADSEDETKVCSWICHWLDEHNIKYERYVNNIVHYATSFEQPVMLSAHLDKVDTNGRAVHFFKDDKECIRGYNERWEQTSLGADDKNGVWLILKLLEEGYDFDFIISQGEEVGGSNGIKTLEKSIEKSLAEYCIVLDRKGAGDVLESGAGTTYCKTLAWNLCNFAELSGFAGFEVTSGSVSDTQTICKHMESVNMSVAYYKPHTEHEYTDFARLLEIFEFLKEAMDHFVHYPTPVDKYTVKSKSYTDKLFDDEERYYGYRY